MKILFFSADNSYSSGAFRSMAYMVEKLCKEGIETKVILPYDGDGKKLLDELKIEYRIIRAYSWIVPKNKIRILSYLKCIYGMLKNLFFVEEKIKKEMISFKPDYVHMNGSWGYIGAKVASILRIPIIWHIREFLEEDQNRKIIFKRYGYKLIDKSKIVICISEALKIKYSRYLKNPYILVLANGIVIEDYLDLEHKILSNLKTNVLMVGGISRSKGQYRVLKELGRANLENVVLHIVGGASGVNRYLWKVYLKMYGSSNTIFHGRKYSVREFYENSDIFIMASRSEAWGRVTVEAMLAGCLVLGSNTGATPEIIDDCKTGVIFDYKAFDLVQKIEYVLHNKNQMVKIAKEGQCKAMREYSADLNAARILQFYCMLERGL